MKQRWVDNPNTSNTIIVIDSSAVFEGTIAQWENNFGGIGYSYSSDGNFLSEDAAIKLIILESKKIFGTHCEIYIKKP